MDAIELSKPQDSRLLIRYTHRIEVRAQCWESIKKRIVIYSEKKDRLNGTCVAGNGSALQNCSESPASEKVVSWQIAEAEMKGYKGFSRIFTGVDDTFTLDAYWNSHSDVHRWIIWNITRYKRIHDNAYEEQRAFIPVVSLPNVKWMLSCYRTQIHGITLNREQTAFFIQSNKHVLSRADELRYR